VYTYRTKQCGLCPGREAHGLNGILEIHATRVLKVVSLLDNQKVRTMGPRR
jgi:hypothetical protein